MMRKFILLIPFQFFLIQGFCQTTFNEVISPSGNYFKSDNYSMSWTLGECVTETFSSAQNMLTQGFQQSSYTITAINQLTTAGITVNAFPNPVTDYITVQVKKEDGSPKEYSIELFDLLGKLLISKKQKDNSYQFDMSAYRKGTYFSRVSNLEKTTIQNFKILKN
jgi:hypothetical protein